MTTTITKYLTDGGIPDGWSVENLRWLAQAHRGLAVRTTTPKDQRDLWHIRWATLIEDLLESRHGQHN